MSPHTVERELPAYLDGELEPAAARRVEAHLDRCASCRELLAALRESSDLLAAWSVPPAGEGLARRVRQEIGGRYGGVPGEDLEGEPDERSRSAPASAACPPLRHRTRRRLLWALPAAAALAAAALLLLREIPAPVESVAPPPPEMLEVLDLLENLDVLERVEEAPAIEALLGAEVPPAPTDEGEAGGRG